MRQNQPSSNFLIGIMITFAVLSTIIILSIYSSTPNAHDGNGTLGWIAFIWIVSILTIVAVIKLSSKQITTMRSPSFDPKMFEAQVADLFRTHGYRVIETPYQGDHGIDLKIIKDDEYAIVQCKRYSGSVGEPIVRDFFGCMQHEGADTGYIVTTGGFTEPAFQWAKGKNIVLIDGIILQKMLDEAVEIKQKRKLKQTMSL